MDYTKLFELCGYDEALLKEQSPRIDKAFQKAGITEKDIARGEERIHDFYEIELEGVRKLLKCWMKEYVNLMLCREENKKVIYTEWPGVAAAMGQGLMKEVPDLYVATPASQTLNIVHGGIFDKLDPVMEAGEQAGFPPGEGHCALWQTHVGALITGLIPKPDLLISPGYLCDIPVEADQLVKEEYGIPVAYIDGCLDWQWGLWPEIPQREIQYGLKRLRQVQKTMGDVAGGALTDEGVNVGFTEIMKIYYNFQPLVAMMAKADPQPTSQTSLDLIFWMTNTPMRHRDEINEAIMILTKEVKERIDKGYGVVPKGAPRIFTAWRIAVDQGVLRMMEDVGLNLSVVCIDWLSPHDYKLTSTDPLSILLEATYRKGVCSSSGAVAYDVEICKTFDLDGAIITYPYSCRLCAIPPIMKKKVIQEECGIPAMVLEADVYDTRQYSPASLRTRVEAFAELLRAKKAVTVA
jgi:hypothetical protein